MSAQFYHRGQRAIEGPRLLVADGAGWDRVEAVYLCQGNSTANGGFVKGQAFPGVPNFWIDTVDSFPCAVNGYLCRITGKGYKAKRTQSNLITFTQGEQHSSVKIAGVVGPGVGGAWPVVDFLLPQVGFRQVIVGAPNISHGLLNLGKAVSAPAEGTFPAAPQSPFTSISNPVLRYPWGWVLARMDADSARPGSYNTAGPWFVVYEYVHRWKVTPG